MCNFSHLHVHSDASQLDGLGTIDNLTLTAANKGFKHLGLTDHGTLSNVVSFVVASKRNNIKPIVGLEGYLLEAQDIFHLTLLASGQQGFSNLIKLNNLAVQSETRRPTFTLNQLKDYSNGIVVLSGCPASPLQSLDWKEARKIGIKLKDWFGDRFFAELMFVQENFPSWERSIQIAKDLKIPLVTTNDVHFHEKEHAKVHDVLRGIKAPYLEYDSKYLWLTTPDEMNERLNGWGLSGYLPYLNEGMTNSFNLAEKIESVKLDPTPSLPEIDNADDKLTHLLTVALIEQKPYDTVYSDRVRFELDVIKQMGFSSYFLILKDILDYAKSVNIKIGPGRGSGAGSLILYLLGITEVDPIEHNLSFERFLNPNRKEMPDVDVDIESFARKEILEYGAKKWGAIPIATFGRYEEKSLVQELVKYYGYDTETKLRASSEGYDGNTTKAIRKDNPDFDNVYNVMLGQIRNTGQHAGGIVITKHADDVPYVRSKDDGLLAGWTEGYNKELTEAGLVKFDFLGLKALDVLRILESKHGKAPLPTDNDPVFEMFKRGDTVGIFQFDTDIMHNLALDIKPDNFNDLVAQVALKLPGPLNAGTTALYTEYKTNPRKLHPIIDDILAETYGIICYQEQFMQIYARVTDGNLADADFARKVIVKAKPGNPEWEAKFSELKNHFFDGCTKKGIDKKLIATIWNEITTHSRYSFNKAHAVSYTMISWQMAYFKYHYPADFYAALLTVRPENADEYIFHCVKNNIEIVMPHVNVSTSNYESKDGKVYMPLTAVKYLSNVAADEIITNRPYNSYNDFAKLPKRKVNKRIKKALQALGAFEGLEGNSDVLEIDEITERNETELQNTYLGYAIPTKQLLDRIEAIEKEGMKGGIIKDIVIKNNGYGDYARYVLLPYGSVWSNNKIFMKNISIGEKLSFKVTDGTGKTPPNKIIEVYNL